MSHANALEWQMLDLINEERTSIGLDALQLDLRLNDAAEDHSLWMIETDQFSHTGINGSSAWDRMEDANFILSGRWTAAENIAWQSLRGEPGLSDDVQGLHVALMNSPGHRDNILDPDSEAIGIGIERGEYDGYDALFATQDFARTDAPLQTDTRDTTPEEPEPPASLDGTLQIGMLTVTQASGEIWHNVSFDQEIEDAIVVMGPVSNAGRDPITVRVQNVTDSGFQFRLEEWEYLDGSHVVETISWMAASEGTYEMADGRTLVAGSSAGDHTATQVDLVGFDEDPLVFTQVASNRGNDTVTSRITSLDADSFQFRLQEEEANGWHLVEQVDWIAMQSGDFDELLSGSLGNVTHRPSAIDHDIDQALLAQMQTLNGGDTANLRYKAYGNISDVWVDEEASLDSETAHIDEAIAFVTADLGTYGLIG